MEPQPTAYKKNTKGKILFWRCEIREDPTNRQAWRRTVSGEVGGAEKVSAWRETKPKNIGKKSETTALQQAESETESAYTKKITKDYFTTEEQAESSTMFDRPFQPMLAQDYRALFEDAAFRGVLKFNKKQSKLFDLALVRGDIGIQPKFDGMRIVAQTDTSRSLWTREGKLLTACPHISEALVGIPDNLIVDGELFSKDLPFEKIMSVCRKAKPTDEDLAESSKHVSMFVYDCYSGETPDMPYRDRIALLQKLLSGRPGIEVLPAPCSVRSRAEIMVRHRHIVDELRQEGSILRRMDAPYATKRCWELLKLKDFYDNEFTVVELIEGEGNKAGMAGATMCVDGEGREFKAGMRGDFTTLRELWADREAFKGGTARVRYPELTGKSGVPRFGVVCDLWQRGQQRED